ncbi:MAG: major capsid protein [Microviridae sp.]|nr:MAG: major capsid protein [Microviridae sp.]
METTIGGDRLGSGNKQTVSFRNYERSSHDLSYVWRSSMASGPLVPFMSKVALPGDKWEIDLNCEVLTLPTIGPLFGSYKVQLDVFEVPMRLYNAKLHMNKLGVGMDMSKIFLPQISLEAVNRGTSGHSQTFDDNEQINPSSLVKYLGISGLGRYTGAGAVKRDFNAVPYLAYYEIFKNYYSNKQEEIGYIIHSTQSAFDTSQTPTYAMAYSADGTPKGACLDPTDTLLAEGDKVVIQYPLSAREPQADLVMFVSGVPSDVPASTIFESTRWDEAKSQFECYGFLSTYEGVWKVKAAPAGPVESPKYWFGLLEFPLENIDKMREKILQHSTSDAFKITSTSDYPYKAPMENVVLDSVNYKAVQFSQEGLCLKTYQSDLFNNWINTEWIDGAGGISELTAVDTSNGDFTIDALNIASKVYDMLNRIAVSGGSYDDWLEAVYTHERVKGVENPVYCGSLIKELAFEEVVSNAMTIDSTADNRKAPLGTLAGRGRLTGKNKGGRIEITVNEPAYIIGLVSITPRVDYSQGNDWDVNLKTFDDFHKPALDGIGFQDLITEQLLWTDTQLNTTTGEVTKNSLGKQPAWVNYMTSVNKTYGGFADANDSMFMTLNRRYEKNSDGTIKDGTTYIDPTKFNNIFAEVSLDSQNFWVQIAANITARRKMSAKIIPNL